MKREQDGHQPPLQMNNIQQAREMVLANRRITIDEVASALNISHGSAHEIIHDELGFHKVCARWVPRQLTAEHKLIRVRVCQRLLSRFSNKGDAFLSRIVTGDETWVHHYEPGSKRQRMQWKHPGSPTKKKFKTGPSAGKVMCFGGCVFV
ncbi:Histone-lysine N-methyltransferase SETMAR like protein [Argiope bruennichi]|uniref:Histone-lysine N-methyltransferase SETMAR like protein n=1 Tax=Argiope bruennichi TaxID=94029 RepID=A0A8T0F4A2_ARGBR|nr:Histone-lysine N-methyltransferase SETMAR like protein [Argiope bruennichi]